jgi:catechol 2,3-dioxygenase-like lactoylglutathione lyase family enzyme
MAETMARTELPAGTCVLDHVAIRVRDRDTVAKELVAALDVRVIERTDRLTLLGPSFAAGKITLLDATEGTEPQATRLISLVLASGAGRAPDAPLVLSCGLVLTFQGGDTDDERTTTAPRHALVGIALRSDDPPIAASLLDAEHGLRAESIGADSASLICGATGDGGFITLVRERSPRARSGDVRQPMLDHIGIRVDDASAWRDYAERANLRLDKWVDAEHSRAVFITGPDDLLIEYVEHTAPMGDD